MPVDARADLFALGAVLYAMAAGRPPFRADSAMAVLKRVCENPHRPIRQLNPDVPDWLEALIDRLLAKDPDDRFQTATEVADLLERGLAHLQQPTTVARPVVPVVSSAHAASARIRSAGSQASTTPPSPAGAGRGVRAAGHGRPGRLGGHGNHPGFRIRRHDPAHQDARGNAGGQV